MKTMCNDAEPHAISELVGYATDTLENFCADLPEESPKDESLMESSNALVELMGLALYWLWVFDHFIDLENVLRSMQSKAEAWIDADPEVTPGQVAALEELILGLEDFTNCAAESFKTPPRHNVLKMREQWTLRRGGFSIDQTLSG
jgi:hypothetical protein